MLSTAQISPDPLLKATLAALRDRISSAAAAAGRDPANIKLLAVSKGQPAARIRAAAQLGLADFGENYVTEALPKIAGLCDLPLRWHFIGRIQANKTRVIASQFDWVHGVDRLQLAQRLSSQRGHFIAPLNICLQVNVLAESSKGGVAPQELPALIQAVRALPRLRLRGLMCILPYEASPAAQADGFGRMQQLLADAVRDGCAMDTLSMGMSGDLEAAVGHGATLLRIGTALFGPRSVNPAPAVE